MRVLKSGNTEIRIRASNLALLYYHQEFGEELMSSLMIIATKLIATQNILEGRKAEEGIKDLDMRNFDFKSLSWGSMAAPASEIFRMCWAMAKAQAFAENHDVGGFEPWLNKLEGVNVRDIEVGVLEEAAEGFFRRGEIREG